MSPVNIQHSERCLSANRFGDFDCICGVPRAWPAGVLPEATTRLAPLSAGDEGVVLLAKIDRLAPRQAAWLYWFRMACNVAMDSECDVARCGAVIVSSSAFQPQLGTYRVFEHSLLSVGFNGPPGRRTAFRRCSNSLPSKRHPKADRTCCVHAEARAILNAPRERLVGSKLYFARVDHAGNLLPSGRPYCTACSKLAIEVGIATWVLWHPDGPREYDSVRYHELSCRYDELMDEEEDASSRQQAVGSESDPKPGACSLQPAASPSGPEDFGGSDYVDPSGSEP